MNRLAKIFLALCCFAAFSPAARAMLVLQLNLEQLTDLSERVFVGKCTDVKSMKDENGRPVIQVTYEVSETLKGPAVSAQNSKLTFRQIALQEEGTIAGREGVVSGQSLPEYKVGEESIVFLSADGPSGLTAPVGFGQGKFEITASNSGKIVRNATDNRGLFVRMDNNPKVLKLKNQSVFNANGDSAGVDRSLNYVDFVSAVRQLSHP